MKSVVVKWRIIITVYKKLGKLFPSAQKHNWCTLTLPKKKVLHIADLIVDNVKISPLISCIYFLCKTILDLLEVYYTHIVNQ